MNTGLYPQIPITAWRIRRDGQAAWHPIAVPGCWEDAGWPATDPGPYMYRAEVDIPPAFAGRRIWLRFDAVSYECAVSVGGRPLGHHIGTWDPFEVEITDAAVPGRVVEIDVEVVKPSSPTSGPDSPTVPGRFALRETLSGFLPYVWGHAFGGVWQNVTLFSTGDRRLLPGSVHVQGAPDGHVSIRGECSAPGPLTLTLFGPDGELVARAEIEATPEFHWDRRLPAPRPWSPDHPALYTAHLSLPDTGDEQQVRFGLRAIAADGPTLLLNGRPIYPRLALAWGWLRDRRCPNASPEQIRAAFAGLRESGFNGVKLCLWVPPACLFELADEMGMLLWLELPMWLPAFTPHFRRQTPIEYERLVRAVRNHPSLILYTLGCELNRAVDASFLTDLYARLKAMAGPVLVRDNSGSGETYGGWLNESADFYDHHFYCELQFVRPLLAAFQPVWREPMPWLMGEFCDHDAVRDWPAILAAQEGRPPWWADPRPEVNPQGARWEMRTPTAWQKLQDSGLAARLPEVLEAGRRQGLLHRKVTLEMVRARPEVSGYVVTGLSDTPISSAGLRDDAGRTRYDPAALRACNDDLVLILGVDRRRRWVAGGDRPSFVDRYNSRAGATVRSHLLVSNYAGLAGPALVTWQAGFPGAAPLAAAECQVTLDSNGGLVSEVALIEFRAPDTEHPARLEIQARLQSGGREWSNRWPVWIYPAGAWEGVPPFRLFDPAGVLTGLPDLAGARCTVLHPGKPVALRHGPVHVCTAWTARVDRFVASGGRVVLLQQSKGLPYPLPAVECPYWREACKLVEPHSAWGDFPHEGDAGLQFYALAPDSALDASALAGSVSPLLRRLDTRGMDLLEYACVVRWGQGRFIATSLRFQGGLGDQPIGLAASPAAEWLLATWIRWLHAQDALRPAAHEA